MQASILKHFPAVQAGTAVSLRPESMTTTAWSLARWETPADNSSQYETVRFVVEDALGKSPRKASAIHRSIPAF